MDKPITPGEILLKDYLEPMGISQNAMSRSIGVSPRAINEIVHGKRSITPVMSIRFGAFFEQSDEFWHGIQVECDFRRLARDKHKLIIGIQPASTLSQIPSPRIKHDFRVYTAGPKRATVWSCPTERLSTALHHEQIQQL